MAATQWSVTTSTPINPCTRVHSHMHTPMHTHVSTCTPTHPGANTQMHTCVHVCARTVIYVCTHVQICAHAVCATSLWSPSSNTCFQQHHVIFSISAVYSLSQIFFGCCRFFALVVKGSILNNTLEGLGVYVLP